VLARSLTTAKITEQRKSADIISLSSTTVT